MQSSSVQFRVRIWPDPSHSNTHYYRRVKKYFSFAVLRFRQSAWTSMYFQISLSLFWCPFSRTSTCPFLTHRVSLCLLLLTPSFFLTILLSENVSHNDFLEFVWIWTSLRENYSQNSYYDTFSESPIEKWFYIQYFIFVRTNLFIMEDVSIHQIFFRHFLRWAQKTISLFSGSYSIDWS